MSQHLSRSGPIVAGKCVFCFWCLSMFPPLPLCLFCFVWCLCRFGDFDFTKHWQAPKKNKKHQTTRSTKPAQAPKKKNPASTQKWAYCCWKVFLFFFLVPVHVSSTSALFFFGACAGLVTLTSQSILFSRNIGCLVKTPLKHCTQTLFQGSSP